MLEITKYNKFNLDLATGSHNLGSDELVIGLTNRMPQVTDQEADHGILPETNGHSLKVVNIAASSQSSGVYTLKPTGTIKYTATGEIGPFRYYILLNNTTNKLIGFWDRGSALTLNAGDDVTLTLPTNLVTISG